jgi:hypothetical protein
MSSLPLPPFLLLAKYPILVSSFNTKVKSSLELFTGLPILKASEKPDSLGIETKISNPPRPT